MPLLHRLTACFVLACALLLYGSTVAPTASFWDVGEFIASAYGLQVMHPPGAPFYMLLGRFFSMFVPPPHVALAVNLVSVLASTLAVVLAYLILVRLITLAQRAARPTPIACFGGLAGALSFAATDAFWFSAVEAEVYALAMLFIALVVWLALRWDALADAEHAAGDRFGPASSRYLVLIAYLYGLAIGIHLMVLLTFFFLALLVFFRRFDRPAWSRSQRVLALGAAGAVAGLVFLVIYPGVAIGVPELMGRSGAPLAVVLGLSVLLAAGLYVTQQRRLRLANLALLCLAALLIGYSTYTLIPIRSSANPAIDLNDPETTEALVPYLKRAQYGQTPIITGHTFNNRLGRLDTSRQVLFPRRHSYDPGHQQLYAQYHSDADYFLRYQLGHMYARYFLWNFAGRASDEQHAPWITGIADRADDRYVYQVPSQQASRNAYFALPLLLGLLGAVVHFRRDGRRALAVLALFLVTGVGLVIYLNEIPVTPRERDYIYVASFFAFSLWIGIGAAWVVEAVTKAVQRVQAPLAKPAAVGAGLLLALAVPGWMIVQNYDDHDRSGNVLARDFAYNLLMSLERDAILFTGGDNDTYPLWYLQEVEGVRRDVRVVCLPLLYTSWYMKQLKNQWTGDAAPVPSSLTDAQIDRIQPRVWRPQEVRLPVDPDRLVEQSEVRLSLEDTSGFERPMTWRLEGRPYNDEFNVLYPTDQFILDMLMTNARQGWQRPIYFATTSGPADQLDLQPYFQREGLAYRVVPIRHDEPGGRVVPEIMTRRLAHFRFTNLADPDVHYRGDMRTRTGLYYRGTFALAASKLLDLRRPAEAKALLDTLMDAVPLDTIPIHVADALPLARAYHTLGEPDRTAEVLHYVEPYVLNDVKTASNQQTLVASVETVQAVQYTYLQAGLFESAARLGDQLADLTGEPAFRRSPDAWRRLYEQR